MLGRARVLPFLRDRTAAASELSVAVAQPDHATALERIVSQAPVRHVHVGAFLDTIDEPLIRERRLWAVLEQDEVVGALQYYRGLSWAVRGGTGLDVRFAEVVARFLDRYGAASEIIFGTRRAVDAVLARTQSHGWHPIEIRLQELLAVPGSYRDDRPAPAGFVMRRAMLADMPWLLEAHAGMCIEDLGVDQVRRHPESYTRYFRDLIGRGRVFVGEVEGHPVFKAETPLQSHQARLVEGVFTVPDARGRGYATYAMVWLARAAARRGLQACLYVHRRNRGARRIYQRIGFERVAAWQTVKLTSAPRSSSDPIVL